MIEGYYDPTLDKVVAQRLLSFYAKGIPSLRQHFDTYERFARATLQQICATSAKPVQELQANWLESTLSLNRGDHFEARPLPVEAQMSPALAICVGDIDGDGNLDLFLSQNFFANQPEIPRYDGGRGLCLRGDGHGGFTPLAAFATWP